MNYVKKSFVLILGLVTLSACSYHPELVYRESKNGHKLVVNPPLTRHFIDNTFVLPNAGKFVPQTTEPPKVS